MATNSKNAGLGILLGLLSSSAFGLIPFFSIPLMTGGMTIPSILFYRFLLSSLFIFPILFFFHRDSMRVGFVQMALLAALSLFFATTSLGLLWSYSFIPSGIATTIHFLYPVLVAVVMIGVFNEKKSLFVVLSALLSFLGVALLCRTDGGVPLKMTGVYIALATVVTYALYLIGVKQYCEGKIQPLAVTFYVVLFCSIFFGIFALATTGIQQITTVTNREWLYLAVLAFFLTALADLALIYSINYAGATPAAILGVMEPAVAVCMGVLFFAEQFTVFSFTGLAVILCSVVIVAIVTNTSINRKL